jgi:hypothetical protein
MAYSHTEASAGYPKSMELVLGKLQPPPNVPPYDIALVHVGVVFLLGLEGREEHARVEKAI